MGFDGLDISRVLDPPLTTVAADAEQLGRIAFELLTAVLAGMRPRSRVLPVERVHRIRTGETDEGAVTPLAEGVESAESG